MVLSTMRIKFLIATAVALSVFGASANAQSDAAGRAQARIMAGVKKLEAGCAADAQKYCTTVTPGDGRLFFCIIAHEDKLSTKCDYALFEASRNLERALNRIEDAAVAARHFLQEDRRRVGKLRVDRHERPGRGQPADAATAPGEQADITPQRPEFGDQGRRTHLRTGGIG